MRFVNTKRFSPIVHCGDLPAEGDLFHFRSSDIDKTKDGRSEFISKHNITTDKEWWYKQYLRCTQGYYVENAIEKGGDAIVDGVDAIWDGDDCYLPQYDLLIKNKTIFIPPRYYFYLNFWTIYGVPEGQTIKQLMKPLFTDMDFLFSRRVEMAYDLKCDDQELKARQKGFEQPNSEPVLTNNGWKSIGDIKIGDKVVTRKNTLANVIDVFKQGEKDVYEIELLDGRKTKCGLNHKWKVYSKFSRKKCEEVYTTEYLINSGLFWNVNNGKNKSYKYALPEIDAVEFNKKELPINPYLLGLLLGDGTINRALKISTTDNEIIDYIKEILGNKYKLVFDKHSNCNYRITYTDLFNEENHKKYGIENNKTYKNLKIKLNPLIEELRRLDLLKKCENKFIPEIYKNSSIEQRLELIRGLMDSDGYISKDGSIEFKNCSKDLSYDLVYILRSLGIKCLIKEFQNKNGYKNYFRVYIKTKKYNIFKLSRKANLFIPTKKINERNPIINIKKLDYKEESTCILLDDDDHIYLTRDFIPTHNSEKMAGMLMAYNFLFLPASINVVVGGTQGDADHTMSNTVRGLDELANTEFYLTRKKGGDRADYIESSKTKSKVLALTAKDNAQTVSRYSPTLVIMEEVGKGKKEWSLETAEFIKPSIVAQNGIKTGWIYYIGCVCSGTKVFTNEGKLINIEDIKQSDGIIGYNFNKISEEKITYIQDELYKPCYRITCQSGEILECSEDHPILWSKHKFNYNKREYVNRQRIVVQEHRKAIWKETKNIEKGDQIAFIESIPIFGKEDMWEPRLIGMLIGDGTYGIDHSPRIFNCDYEINNYVERRYDSKVTRSYITKDNKEYKEIRIKGICNKLKELGIYGQTKKNKRLPLDIHKYNKNSLQELIAGLFDTDGCIYIMKLKSGNRIKIQLSQSNKEILIEIKYLLLRFGISCNIYKAKIAKRKTKRTIKDNGNTWILEINKYESLIKFKDNFNLLIKYKQKNLDLISEYHLSGKVAKYWVMVKDYDKHKKEVSLDYLNALRFEKVKTIEYIGIQRVYNLTANTTHTYIANGIITHNTGGEMSDGVYDLEQRCYNPKEYNLLSFKNTWTELTTNYGQEVSHFTPAWWMKVMDKDGNTLKEESLKLIDEEYKKTASEKKYRFKTQSPIFIENVFLSSDAGYFGKDVIMLLNNRYASIVGNKAFQIEKQYVLEFKNSKNPFSGVIFKPKENGWLNVIELPCKDNNDDIYLNLYHAGCILPGGKVKTKRGYVNVENVLKNDKLINENGDLVNITKFYKNKKVNSNVYELKISNTYTTNILTEEHPVLISEPKFFSDKTINEKKFDFQYKRTDEIKVGDWTRIPNQYSKSNDFNYLKLWESNKYRIDRRIKNPLNEKDFWWFLGIWLGDGFCIDNRITICINKKEQYYIDKLTRVVNNLFKRNISYRDRNNNCIECIFTFSQLSNFLLGNFGKYSHGKYIPEWVKYINKNLKNNLLLGYLNSDGCIYKQPRGYYQLCYVSINLGLLESIQDIAFSIGYISNLCKLRNEKIHKFRNIEYSTKVCYQLRFGHHDVLNLIKDINCFDDPKIQKIDFDNIKETRKRPKEDCFISECGNYIYFKIKEIKKSIYTGIVYNFECDTHTYLGPNISYHNCDSYDQDEAHTSTSKGAMYIKKGYLPGHAIVNNWVAEIIERPTIADGGAKTFYLHTAMACIAYSCQNNIEYSNLRIFDFYETNGFTSLLKLRPIIAFAGKIQNTKVSNRYGTDKSLKPHILAILRDILSPDVINNMYFTRQIRALSKFIYDPSGKKYNCDITIATAECEVSYKENEGLTAKSKGEYKKELMKRYETDSRGHIQIVYK